jgi:hypothetical protein
MMTTKKMRISDDARLARAAVLTHDGWRGAVEDPIGN